ncbi:MAG TPA: hypothetical protein VIK27_07230 [Candidatus Aquilonibacter sp.]
MHTAVGASIVRLWERSGAPSLFVVGTGKNVGKTVTMRAIYHALLAAGTLPALASIGRDGEAVDIGDAGEKPRLWLEPGTVVATARGVLPRSPGSEMLDLSDLPTAAGMLVYARVRYAAHYELIGPPSASAMRAVVHRLQAFAPRVLVDGAIDRVAALAGGEDAVVIATGASAASTIGEAVDGIRALAVRLTTPAPEDGEEVLEIGGALTPGRVAELLRKRETRAVVVRDPTQIALTGKAALAAFAQLRIRCRRPLRVIAATVSSAGRDRAFEPRELVRAVAAATGLPTFDVFAAEQAA